MDVAYSKGQMEDEITKAMIHWEREYKGRGPTEAKTDILRNMVIVQLRGILTPAECHLAQNKDGMVLIKKLRQQLVEQGRPQLEEIVKKVTSANVISLHTDISTKTGERLFVFMLDKEI
nr:Na-translocating system protein MpsC family protein [Dethiobacter alkaliphilus]